MTKRAIKPTEKLKATLDSHQSGRKRKPEVSDSLSDTPANPPKKTKSVTVLLDSGSEDDEQSPRQADGVERDTEIPDDETEKGEPEEGAEEESPQDELGASKY